MVFCLARERACAKYDIDPKRVKSTKMAAPYRPNNSRRKRELNENDIHTRGTSAYIYFYRSFTRFIRRFDSEKAGDREVQRTMLELLNQLDGFSSSSQIKVIAATNRVDILDPALLRSGRLDRKIEFPHPNEEARARIMQIHSSKATK